ncbi:MAG: 16S rRNA (guanine(527)-N(7))-methyltransferase RsmG [Halothiobacillaceae bacterium]
MDKVERPILARQLADGITGMGLVIPDKTQAILLDYLELLAKWNRVYNLTAIRDPLKMIDKHLLDSLSLLPHLEDAPLLDVGAGAGLPGLVLAIVKSNAAPPQEEGVFSVTLVDAAAKKVRFMEHAIRSLKLTHARALHARIESMEGHYPQITSRAFASLTDFLTFTRHLLAPGGRWLAMKGKIPHDELAQLPAWAEAVATPRLAAPAILGERHLIILRDKETS